MNRPLPPRRRRKHTGPAEGGGRRLPHSSTRTRIPVSATVRRAADRVARTPRAGTRPRPACILNLPDHRLWRWCPVHGRAVSESLRLV